MILARLGGGLSAVGQHGDRLLGATGLMAAGRVQASEQHRVVAMLLGPLAAGGRRLGRRSPADEAAALPDSGEGTGRLYGINPAEDSLDVGQALLRCSVIWMPCELAAEMVWRANWLCG